MAKGKSNVLYYIFVILAIIFGGIGIAAIALPAFKGTYGGSPLTVEIEATLAKFIFGDGNMAYTSTLDLGVLGTHTSEGMVPITGGLSYTGIAAFGALALALLLLLIGLFKRSKFLTVFAGLLLIAGGVCILFFNQVGTNVSLIFDIEGKQYPILEDASFTELFAKFDEHSQIGLGTIIFCIGGCLSGISSIIAAVVKK